MTFVVNYIMYIYNIFVQLNRLTVKRLIKRCNYIKCRVQLVTQAWQSDARTWLLISLVISYVRSQIALHRRSNYVPRGISVASIGYAWDVPLMRRRCHVYIYKRTHNSVSGISRNRSLFQEHCHDYSRCRNGTENGNVRYEQSLSPFLNHHSNRAI